MQTSTKIWLGVGVSAVLIGTITAIYFYKKKNPPSKQVGSVASKPNNAGIGGYDGSGIIVSAPFTAVLGSAKPREYYF